MTKHRKKRWGYAAALTLITALLLGITGCGGGKTAAEEKPPEMTISLSDTAEKESTVYAQEGITIGAVGYGWSWPKKNGEMMGVEADAVGPLDPRAPLPLVPVGDGTGNAVISFPRKPSAITISCWTSEKAGIGWVDADFTLQVGEDGAIRLLPGLICDAHVYFPDEGGAYGDGNYYFMTDGKPLSESALEKELEKYEEDGILVQSSSGKGGTGA